MKTYSYRQLSPDELENVLRRPKMDQADTNEKVTPILQAVKEKGDEAVADYTEKFDKIRPDPLVIKPSEQQITLPEHIKRAIDTAFQNICKFHEAQYPPSVSVQTMEGVNCFREPRPIEKVGLYVPGGTAKLPSTALMLAIPAMLAGCSDIVLATPPNEEGNVAPEVIYIAQKTGVAHILISGGAQAIAAMAYGTASVPKVDKLFGPGNQFVTAAKMILQNSDAMVSIDMPAGPSEVLVLADEAADPRFVAADLLSQAEHGVDSQVGLIAVSSFDFRALEEELQVQLDTLPRVQIALQALKNSFIIEVDNMEEAFELSNRYAPEHLILNLKNAESFTEYIQHAGSVFLGAWTPESAGDYASGTNHTLPTYGYARMHSGVSLESFMKQITFQQITPKGLQKLGGTVQILAEIEQLEAHKQAVVKRLEEIRKNG